MIAYGWRRDLKYVGDEALMCELATAFPLMTPGCPILRRASALKPATKHLDGGSPGVVPPRPWARERFRCFRQPFPVAASLFWSLLDLNFDRCYLARAFLLSA